MGRFEIFRQAIGLLGEIRRKKFAEAHFTHFPKMLMFLVNCITFSSSFRHSCRISRWKKTVSTRDREPVKSLCFVESKTTMFMHLWSWRWQCQCSSLAQMKNDSAVGRGKDAATFVFKNSRRRTDLAEFYPHKQLFDIFAPG